MSTWITDKTIKSMYSLLRSMPPFNKWNLPPAYKLKFRVIHDFDLLGEMDVHKLVMKIGTKHQEHFESVLTTVAHEMVHLSLYIDGCASFNQHRKPFRMKTAQIGDLYGFDRKML